MLAVNNVADVELSAFEVVWISGDIIWIVDKVNSVESLSIAVVIVGVRVKIVTVEEESVKITCVEVDIFDVGTETSLAVVVLSEKPVNWMFLICLLST